MQEQIENSTRLVEGIKAEVAHADWARREWFGIRSQKLEKLHELLADLIAKVDVAIKAMEGDLDSQAILNEPHTLAMLYFPELLPKVESFLDDVGVYFARLTNSRLKHLEGAAIDWTALPAPRKLLGAT